MMETEVGVRYDAGPMAVNSRGEVKPVDWTSGQKLDEEGQALLFHPSAQMYRHRPEDGAHQACRAEGWPLDRRLKL